MNEGLKSGVVHVPLKRERENEREKERENLALIHS